MKKKLVIILLSDPQSTSEQIILKSLNIFIKTKNNYLFIGNTNLFPKLAKKIFVINSLSNFDKNKINFFNVKMKLNSIKNYINLITNVSVNFLKQNKSIALINMPINKKHLGKKNIGYTEFFAKKIGQLGKESMLIFNNNLAVCPLTTHVKLKDVSKLITKKKILNAIKNINFFYRKFLKKKIKIKVCGLNPHASKDFFNKNNEDYKIIEPAIKEIKKKNKNVSGPYSSDTIFLNSNNSVIVGMYHDQVLSPFKTLKKFNAINVTIGLKYLRISPDHGTGLDILNNKNKICTDSFKYCIYFCEKYLNE